MGRLIFLGWVLVVVITALQPSWLIGPASVLAVLLPGSQGNPGYEGIEAVLVLGTLPVLIGIARMERR